MDGQSETNIPPQQLRCAGGGGGGGGGGGIMRVGVTLAEIILMRIV